MFKDKSNLIFFSIVATALILAGALIYINKSSCEVAVVGMPMDTAAENAIAYINQYFLEPGIIAILNEVVEEGDIYRINLTVLEEETGEPLSDFDSYVSRDGKFLFPDGYNLNESYNSFGSPMEEVEITKSDKPKIELFVMSFCPYGNQAEETMLPVYNLLKDKVDWNIHYIVDDEGDTIGSLHGEIEVAQNQREACVLKEYGLDQWWNFVSYVNNNCGYDGTCWQGAANSLSLNASLIDSCVTTEGTRLMKEEAAIARIAGVMGSPTLRVNGAEVNAVYQYGRPQAYLDVICSAFNLEPEECSVELEDLVNMSSGGSC